MVHVKQQLNTLNGQFEARGVDCRKTAQDYADAAMQLTNTKQQIDTLTGQLLRQQGAVVDLRNYLQQQEICSMDLSGMFKREIEERTKTANDELVHVQQQLAEQTTLLAQAQQQAQSQQAQYEQQVYYNTNPLLFHRRTTIDTRRTGEG